MGGASGTALGAPKGRFFEGGCRIETLAGQGVVHCAMCSMLPVLVVHAHCAMCSAVHYCRQWLQLCAVPRVQPVCPHLPALPALT